MCVLVLEWRPGGSRPLCLAGNRDELHARPTAVLDRWRPDGSDRELIAGRDLEAGGTWLALSMDRRFAVVTNFREPAESQPDAPSRGGLVTDALTAVSLDRFLEQLRDSAMDYAGFNLIFGEPERGVLRYFSNRDGGRDETITPGRHGLSNHALDTPWPKVERLLAGFDADADEDALLGLLEDRHEARADSLPDTGVGEDLERLLSPPFIVSPEYGTRASIVVRFEGGHVTLCERRFDAAGIATGTTRARLSARPDRDLELAQEG